MDVLSKEVISVPTTTLKEHDRATVPSTSEDPLHEWATKHLERVRKLKINVAAYFVGMLVLTCVWVVTQWSDNGAFERLDFSPEGAPGAWEPWIIYPGLIWGLLVVIDAFKVHFDRPVTEEDIEREIRRLP